MRLLDGSVPLSSPAIVAPYVSCERGVAEDDFPEAVRGRIALVERGDATFLAKATAAQSAGAIACLIYNNQPGLFFGTLSSEAERPAIPVVAISQEDGRTLVDLLSQSQADQPLLTLEPEALPQPDRIAEFASRGPNNDGWNKPEITGPGVDIYSATIQQAPNLGDGMPDPSGYLSASGTSMATPHVAGAAALLCQAHPDWSPPLIKAALVNTARFMHGQGTVLDQGVGALELVAAMEAKAILVTGAEEFSPTYSFGRVVHGGEEREVNMNLRLIALPGTSDPEEWTVQAELAVPVQGLTAAVSAERLLLPPGGAENVQASLTADGQVLADGAYYGWIVARSGEATLRLPFYL